MPTQVTARPTSSCAIILVDDELSPVRPDLGKRSHQTVNHRTVYRKLTPDPRNSWQMPRQCTVGS